MGKLVFRCKPVNARTQVERGKRQLKTTLFGSLDSTTAIAEESLQR